LSKDKDKKVKLPKIEMINGGYYEGDWRNGMREGCGKHTWPDQSYYEGEWVADKAEGKGKLKHVDGDIYEG
jgi:hypothetical protein